MCHLVARDLHNVAEHYFDLFIYTIQLYEEDCESCKYVGLWGLAGQEQFPLSSVNTAQTVGKFLVRSLIFN